MATESGDSLSAASALLKAGKTTEADQMITRLDQAAKAAAGAGAEPPEPAQPRKPEEVIVDIFTAIHSILGTSPALVPLIAELKDVLKPAAPAAKPSA